MDPTVFPEGQCRLILIGKTGNGKSATGNTILGFPAFKTQIGVNSGTQFGDLKSTDYKGVKLKVVDTPGLHDTELPDDEMVRRITKSLLAITPGPHAILLCLSCEQRFTPEEMDVVETLKHAFGEKMMSHLIVVFVKKDLLEAAGSRFEGQLKRNTNLIELMKQINNRYVLFDNRPGLNESRRNRQVQQLLQQVAAVVKQNGNSCFKHKLSAEMESSMQAMKQAELRKQEQQRGTSSHRVSGKMLKVPKSPPVLARFEEDEEEEEEEEEELEKEEEEQEEEQEEVEEGASNPMLSTLGFLREWKPVTRGVKHFETGASQQLTSKEMAAKSMPKTKNELKVKSQDPAAGGRKKPTADSRLGRNSDQKASPEKRPRIHPRKIARESKSATRDVKHFKAGASQQPTSEKMADKFTLKTKDEQRVKSRAAPTAGSRKEPTADSKPGRNSDQKASPEKPPRIPPRKIAREVETASAKISRFHFTPQYSSSGQGFETGSTPNKTFEPEKPPRIPPRKIAREVETASAEISRFHFTPQYSSSGQGFETGSNPNKTFECEVTDKPGISWEEKQGMVEEALKRKLARNESLSDEQMKELEKASKSVGKKLREGMTRFRVRALGMCRLM